MLQLGTPEKKYHHNFKRVYRFQNDMPALRKPKKGWAKFWCNQCDTLVEYSQGFTELMVNQKMAESMLPCVGEIDGVINPFIPKGIIS